MAYIIINLTSTNQKASLNILEQAHQPEFIALLRRVLSILAALDIETLRMLSKNMKSFGVQFDIKDSIIHINEDYSCGNKLSLSVADREGFTEMSQQQESLSSPEYTIDSDQSPTAETTKASQTQSTLDEGLVALRKSRYSIRSITSPSHTNENIMERASSTVHSCDNITPSRYLRAYRIMTDKFGDKLRPSSIISAIRAGDELLRVDAVRFIRSHLSIWAEKGVWDKPFVIIPTRDDSNLASFIKLLKCTDILARSLECNDIQLRIAQVLLYRHYEQLLSDIKQEGQAVGQRLSSYTVDFLLRQIHMEEWDHMDETMRQEYRKRLQHSKAMGRRWLTLTSYFGYGILLICGKGPIRIVKDRSFTLDAFYALAMYVQNVLPKVMRACWLLDQLARSMVDMEPVQDVALLQFSHFCGEDWGSKYDESTFSEDTWKLSKVRHLPYASTSTPSQYSQDISEA